MSAAAALRDLRAKLRRLGSPEKAAIAQRFFKTGPGEYGAGDKFLGVTVPQVRALMRECSAGATLVPAVVPALLKSKWHEERLLALLILVSRFEAAPSARERTAICRAYLRDRAGVNNWDLVDLSAYKILGQHCLETGDQRPLNKLLKSKRHWDRRLAIVATFAFIRAGKLELTFDYAHNLLGDKEDLMHKATGWMLREAGKRDAARLRAFIRREGRRMPRTMLRYAIEKFPAAERRRILKTTR